MNKITVVIPKKKSQKLLGVLKAKGISKYIELTAGESYKYEVFVTELKTQELIKDLKKELGIHTGKPTEEGFMTVHDINVVAPYTEEKGKTVELEELILKDAKRFIKLDRSYLIFTICGAAIACLGFQLDSIIALIGSMLIAPLMSPIMAVSYGLAKTKRVLVMKGLKTELSSIFLILLVSLFMSLLPNPSLSLEKIIINESVLLILLLSIVIGVVAANSFITGSYEILTGVAVGISLLPPLTNSVLLFVAGEVGLALGSFLSFMLNILGMHLSALITSSIIIERS